MVRYRGNEQTMQTPNVIITGTFVGSNVGTAYYGPLAAALDAEIICLNRHGLVHTRNSAEQIAAHLQRRYGGPVRAFGHSQGGLVAAMLAHQAPEVVSQAVCISAPLAGTALAQRIVPIPALRCMSTHSRLCASVRPSPGMHTIVGDRDRVILPWSSALLDGTDQHILRGASHISICWDRRLLALCRQIATAPQSQLQAA